MKFYKFDIFETKEKISYVENNIPKCILEKLQNLPGDTLDTWVSDKHLVSYVYIKETDLDFFLNIFFDNNINFKFIDITFDVMIGNYKFSDNDFDSLKSDYIKDNLTVDIVLDKINIKGIKSLSNLDKLVLKHS